MDSDRELTNSDAAARAASSPFSRRSLNAKSTRALPTTTASAERAAACAISGDDLPVIAENTVSAMKMAGLCRLIFMGAVGIYDEIPAYMDDEDNVKNNPDQIPNRKAADIVEESGLDYTILRPGYLRDGDKDDFTLTFKGEQAKGYVSTIPSVVGLAVRLIHDDTLYVRQSVSITRDMSDTEKL